MLINRQKIIDSFENSNSEIYANRFFDDLGENILEELDDIKLIGEIERPEGIDTYNALKACLKQYLDLREEPQFFNPSIFSTRESRAVLSLYFVWTGIFHYGEKQGHELWDHVFNGLGRQPKSGISTQCGQLFFQCLTENNLEKFRRINTGYRQNYVTSILLHGLIPDTQIDRFFKNFVFEELKYEKAVFYTGEVIIRNWLNNRGLLDYQPKPIQNFIKYGDPVNAKLVERLWEMIRHWDKDEDPELWWRWGIPKYMMAAFKRCLTSRHASNMKIAYKKKHIGARPYLYFDFGRSDYPLFCIPPQKIEPESTLEIVGRSIDKMSEICERIPISDYTILNNNYFSKYYEFPVPPCVHLQLSAVNSKTRSIFERKVNIPFLLNENEVPLPLLFFNSNTNKVINIGESNSLPREIIIILPKEGQLDLDGGSIITDEIQMSNNWADWKFLACEIDGDLSILYIGPGLNPDTKIEETISVVNNNPRSKDPFIDCDSDIPSWLKCEGNFPILVDPKTIHLNFPEKSYLTWKRAVGSIVRLDFPNQKFTIPYFRFEFSKAKNGKKAYIHGLSDIEPGVYQINIRGTLGTDDISVPFVYLPISSFEQIKDETKEEITDKFLMTFSKEVSFETLENTEIKYGVGKNDFSIEPTEDNGDAYCALKMFEKSNHPIVLLCARSAIRWVRRSEQGLFHWKFWRVKPEDIPIQRIDELQDSRVLIEIDEDAKKNIATTFHGRKLKILLNGRQNGSETIPVTSLMSHEASKFKRNKKNLWVINLKQFGDQLKSLKDAPDAQIEIITYNSKLNRTLFSLLKQPAFENFSIKIENRSRDKEIIKVDWKHHPNDPVKNRKIDFIQEGSDRRVIVKEIPDNDHPPYAFEFEPTDKAEIWSVTVGIKTSRFGMNRFVKQQTSGISKRWLRVPLNWADWIQWPEININESEGNELIQKLTEDSSEEKNLPWITFLQFFHNAIDEYSFEKLIDMVGFEAIKKMLPFSKGCRWEVKNYSNVFLELLVSSGITARSCCGGYNCRPVDWGVNIPCDVAIDLTMKKNHQYLGSYDSIWCCKKREESEEPEMISPVDGVLDLSTWMDDAIESSNKGRLVALLPIRSVWANPPTVNICRLAS